MLPRWHILYGALFTLVLWLVVPEIKPLYLVLVFLSSFLIDFDHYVCAVWRTGKIGLGSAFGYHRVSDKRQRAEKLQGIRQRGDFHIFHTIEFHILIALLAIIWTPFVYVFIGMVFHSLLDIYSLLYHDYMYRREFFFFSWLRRRMGS